MFQRLDAMLPDFPVRYTFMALCVFGALLALFSLLVFGVGWVVFMVFAGLAGLGIRDLRQTRHAILRNYPVIGHLRFLFEYIRPEIRQYFVESDSESTPFSRAQRSLVYQRERVSIGAAGKVITAFDMSRLLALGADWCNAGRGFMMALGCIQAQSCHTGKCPTGVSTQDPVRQQALVVPDKAERVRNFHRSTLHALQELVQAAGLDHPCELNADHIVRRLSNTEVRLLSNLIMKVEPGALLGALDELHNVFKLYWPLANPQSFRARAAKG